MALPVTITGISTAVSPVGPFKLAAGIYGSPVFSTTTSGNNGSSAGPSTAQTKFAQSITAPSSFNLGQTTWYMAAQFTSTVTAFIEVRTGSPTGTLIGSSDVLDISSLNTLSPLPRTFTFSTPVALTNGSTYYLVLVRSAASAAEDFTVFGNATNDYAGGTAYTPTTIDSFNPRSLAPFDWRIDIAAAVSKPDTYYFFGRDGTTATTLQAFKSTAPDTSWASAATKTGFTTAILNICGYQVGTVIHLLVQDGTMSSSVATKYLSYDMSNDTFLATTETVSAAQTITGTAAANWGCSLVVRSNGNVVAFYNGLQTKTGGTFYSRVYYRVRTAVNTYGTETEVDANAAINNTKPFCVLGSSDRTHLLFFNGTNVMQRHLTSANVLGTAASTGATSIAFDVDTLNDAGTIRHTGFTATQTFRWTSADNPTVTAASVTFGTPVRTVDDNGIVYALYQNSADSDLYIKSSTDFGATFGTGADIFTATVAAADANISNNQTAYQRGSNFVFPYIANDNATLKYNEYVVRSVGKSVIANSGSYSLAGTAATLTHQWRLSVTAGSHALTGTNAQLAKGKILVAGSANYALGGTATTSLLHTYRPTALAGSYGLVGANTTAVRRKWTIAAGSSSYTLTGAVVSILGWRKITAFVASYALTGTIAVLAKADRLQAIAGSYTLTGTVADITYGRKFVATVGSYALAGTTANIEYDRKVAADAASYVIVGVPATLAVRAGVFVSAQAGSYTLSGAPASVLHYWVLSAPGGSYALVGSPVDVLAPSAAPPVFGGGEIAEPLRPYPVVGTGFGILSPIEGEAYGVVVSGGFGVGIVATLSGKAQASAGVAGRSATELVVRAVAFGDRGQVGAADAIFEPLMAAGVGTVAAHGKGFGPIMFKAMAKGRHDDGEEAAVLTLLAA